MKLTTARLKKLIREELNRMNEMDQQNPQHKDIFMIIINVGMEQGLPEPVAGGIAEKATNEITKSGGGISGQSMNVKKGMAPMPQPSSEEEEIFMIIINVAMEQGLPERQAGALAHAAASQVVSAKSGQLSPYAINTKKQR
jgi:hypothetical protein